MNVKNTKQETKRFSTSTVYRLRHSETQKKTVLDSRIMFSAEHLWNSQSTIYLKSHGWVHGFQHEVLLINFSTMFCLTCALSRNRSLQDAIPAGHLFVWFTKHCLAKHCLSVQGDSDKCEKQFCFVFRICLVFYDVPLRWALACLPLRR